MEDRVDVGFLSLRESLLGYSKSYYESIWSDIIKEINGEKSIRDTLDYRTILRACVEHYEFDLINSEQLMNDFINKINNLETDEFYFDLIFICQNNPGLKRLWIKNSQFDNND